MSRIQTQDLNVVIQKCQKTKLCLTFLRVCVNLPAFVFLLSRRVSTCAMTSCDQMSEAEVMCCPFVVSDSEGLSRVGPNTVARLWRDILLMGSFSATLQDKKHQRTISQDWWNTQRSTHHLIIQRIIKCLGTMSPQINFPNYNPYIHK